MATNDDSGLLVRFFKSMERNDTRSAASGKAEFDEVELISIRVPGSRDEHVALVNDEYRERFKEQYRAWNASEGAPVVGTPLSEWPAATTSFIDEMKLIGIRTVEQLAGVSDGHAMAHTGLMTMKARAQAWLSEQDAASALTKANTEIEELRARLAALEAGTAPKPRKANVPKTAEVVDPAALSDEELEAMTAPATAA